MEYFGQNGQKMGLGQESRKDTKEQDIVTKKTFKLYSKLEKAH